jgi:hypothetical protein
MSRDFIQRQQLIDLGVSEHTPPLRELITNKSSVLKAYCNSVTCVGPHATNRVLVQNPTKTKRCPNCGSSVFYKKNKTMGKTNA